MKATGDTSVEKLLSISSEPLAARPQLSAKMLDSYARGSELLRMLQRKNGFYALESALHVLPLTSPDCMSLEEWNSDSLWRDSYQDLADGLLFFAEDAFQDQFCLSADGVARFKPETGETVFLGDSIERWAEILLGDFNQGAGWTLASRWHGAKGPLPRGKRLMPKIPFFLDGKYSIDNLWVGDAVEGMRFKGDLAVQTRNLPEGSVVKLNIGRKPAQQ